MNDYPAALHPALSGAKLYDSSCSDEARVIFIDKDDGFFLKCAPQGALQREAEMTRYFHSKGLAAPVLLYLRDEKDWLLTKKVHGSDCTVAAYLEKPERLCGLLAEQLLRLHTEDYSGCPVPNHTAAYLAAAEHNRENGTYDKSHFPDSFGYKNDAKARAVLETRAHLLQADTLLHGDYCLPNIILDNWHFSGFIDLDSAGVGDRHVDLFWGIWTLRFNLKTDKYRSRFIDAYGRDKVDEERLRIVAAAEVFG